MKRKLACNLILVVILAITLFPGNGQSATMNDIIPIQGKLTDSAGIPLNGSYSITANIYNVSTGGVALCSDTDSVTVTNGLFTFNMNFCAPTDLSGAEQLYLGLKVGSDSEMTPRQPIYANPFAWGIRANTLGGDIKQPIGNHGLIKAAVYVQSCGDGAPVIVRSFNNVNSTAITVTAGASAGRCTLDFGFDVTGRYVVATAYGTGIARMVTFDPGVDNQKYDFFRFTDAGVGSTGNIMVLVY
jgi:hypothetical protein